MSSGWASRWTARAGLVTTVVVGAVILVLSFVPGWLTQERVLQGEGPRTLLSYPFAWQGQALPVVAAGVACVVGAAVASLAALTVESRLARPASFVLLAMGLGLLAGSLWPVSQTGHASSVALVPGWPVMVATVGALLALVVMLVARRPAPTMIGVLAVVVLVASVGSALGRQAWLNFQEDSTQHYAQGSYTRIATGGEPTETLTLSGSTFRVGEPGRDRWSGSYQPDGLVIIFTGDPACPSARGSYHAHAAGSGGDIRLEAIVDLCAGGDRKRDLESGTWVRNR